MRFLRLMMALPALCLTPAVPAQEPAEETAGHAVGTEAESGYLGAKVALAKEREAWLRSMFEEVKRLQAAGEASETDVAQVAARLALARAEVVRLRGALRRAQAEYESTVGQPPPGAESKSPP